MNYETRSLCAYYVCLLFVSPISLAVVKLLYRTITASKLKTKEEELNVNIK